MRPDFLLLGGHAFATVEGSFSERRERDLLREGGRAWTVSVEIEDDAQADALRSLMAGGAVRMVEPDGTLVERVVIAPTAIPLVTDLATVQLELTELYLSTDADLSDLGSLDFSDADNAHWFMLL
jgi:hypothetical protein